MPPLLRIRGERDRMSAIERRIADFMLENAHLLRDYSSQQLADALGISQSSVVKFSQKLGFKGYPDLKYSIGESLARGDGKPAAGAHADDALDPHAALAGTLWEAKAQAEQATRVLNPPDRLDAIAVAIRGAGKVFVVGAGQDSVVARAFSMKLSMLGILALHHYDPVLMPVGTSSAGPGDVLLVFSEHGGQAALCHTARLFRERQGTVVSVTRHSANPLRAHADIPLLVSAHEARSHVELLLYQAALQHLLDLVFLLLCRDEAHLRALDANIEDLQAMATT
jgi:DNA-binding MurR/RpiR family transcriptional regulator